MGGQVRHRVRCRGNRKTGPGRGCGRGAAPESLRSGSEVALDRDHPLTRSARLAFRYVRGSSTVHLVDVVEVIGQVGDSHGCFPILRHGLPRDAGVGQRASTDQPQRIVADLGVEARLVVRIDARSHTTGGAQRQHVLHADVVLAIRSVRLMGVQSYTWNLNTGEVELRQVELQIAGRSVDLQTTERTGLHLDLYALDVRGADVDGRRVLVADVADDQLLCVDERDVIVLVEEPGCVYAKVVIEEVGLEAHFRRLHRFRSEWHRFLGNKRSRVDATAPEPG